MRAHIRDLPRFSDLVDGVEMTEEVVAKLATVAIMQAHHVASAIREVVVPLLPPVKRTFAEGIARRIERGPIFEESLLRDIETFESILAQQIAAGTHSFWHGDENHVRGGYVSVYREDDACELAEVVAELALLADMILATLSAAHAVRQAGALIDS
ncbi:MAG: hypothetical protein ACJASC_002324 [Limimaricola cinnabarinus]|jgi:hypothetical protein|uniref:hypothetical protein n=1 Tax=Limimaricola cinnabarinus TaxID=1125964 RepID=UPI0039E41B2A